MVTAVADHIKEYRDEALASTGTAPPLGAPSPCPGGPVDAVTPDRHPSRARDPTGRPSSVRARPGTAAGTARGEDAGLVVRSVGTDLAHEQRGRPLRPAETADRSTRSAMSTTA